MRCAKCPYYEKNTATYVFTMFYEDGVEMDDYLCAVHNHEKVVFCEGYNFVYSSELIVPCTWCKENRHYCQAVARLTSINFPHEDVCLNCYASIEVDETVTVGGLHGVSLIRA